MRAKNEFRLISEAYDTKLLLERIVNGELMCPEACCGAPVMECKCGPDCEHCNCHEIQKLAAKEEDAEQQVTYPGREPVTQQVVHMQGDLDGHHNNFKKITVPATADKLIANWERRGLQVVEEPSENAEDLSGGWSSSRDWAGEMEDKKEAMRKKVAEIRAKRQESEGTEDIFPNSEYGDHLRREAERHKQEDNETDRAFATPELKRKDKERQMRDAGIIKDRAFATPELKRKEARDQMWAKRKARWDAWKKGQVRSEDAEDPYTTLDATVRDFEQELDIQGDGIDTNVNELKDYIDIIKGLKVSEVQKKSALKYLSELNGPGGRVGLEDVDYNFVFGVDV